ncbi:DNA polymerase thumb domain-containing protein [Lentibacillus saliphilus]|uniref:Y-family DNA polymerase n=1 Tax=Lentibacillus saliphilus TaxID=2737028 RepID=UPI001C2FC3A3|nr:UV damage repair protein UvrX [Lentibacillus saliphilus]
MTMYSDSERHVLCVDMKSFYASCAAMAKGLDLLTTYLAVVADINRKGSVVLAASPALKRDFGIRTGSRLFEIPDHEKIVIVSAQMKLYLRVSTEITRLFHKYVPKEAIHTYSVDESFLELSGTHKLWGSAEEVASRIIEELKDTFGLTAAIGIGPNMLMAKLCLDLEAKQTGIARWTYADVPKKLWTIRPLSKMWGIGPQLERRLNRMGISTVGQLANYSLPHLEKAFGIMGNQLYHHANGIDLSELGAPIMQGQKSYGKSQILLRDYHRPTDVAYVILEICEEVGRRARANQHAGRTISLGIGYSKTEGGGGFHRSLTIATPTNITMDIYHTAMHLFKTFYAEKTVRRIAVTLDNICEDEHVQLDLFAKDRTKARTLGYVVDEIRDKYGSDALLRAVSFTEAGTALERSKLVGGHYAE